jgi:adenylosuccinate synthase
MKIPKVVIGANYGDEGKGLITDYLASKSGRHTLVVRFNGGAQAGHTVVTPTSKTRHVFHHFGSGSFTGAETYLSKYFIVNPVLWEKERDSLEILSHVRLRVDTECLVTTPYDMIFNQYLEKSRGNRRHGSCGIGINETVERSQNELNRITVADLYESKNLSDKLQNVSIYFQNRVKQMNITVDTMFDYWMRDGIFMKRFIKTCEIFKERIEPVKYHAEKCGDVIAHGKIEILRNNDIIFEGAQGLLLDETHANFPYVTRSRTGLHNVLELAHLAGFEMMDVIYVTRTYMTRHGMGPFPTEFQGPFSVPCEYCEASEADETNVENEFQGKLRLGYLDVKSLISNITKDLSLAEDKIRVIPHLAVTCLDHASDGVIACEGTTKLKGTECFDIYEFLDLALGNSYKVGSKQLSLESILTSSGPTRKDVLTYSRGMLGL